MQHGELRWAGEPDEPRPVLIVQSNLFEDAPTVVVVPVTLKKLAAPWPFNVHLPPAAAGIDAPSWIRLTQPSTLRRDKLGELIGTLPANVLQEVLSGLALILNIPSDISPPAIPT